MLWSHWFPAPVTAPSMGAGQRPLTDLLWTVCTDCLRQRVDRFEADHPRLFGAVA